jgi:hypothetical protein
MAIYRPSRNSTLEPEEIIRRTEAYEQPRDRRRGWYSVACEMVAKEAKRIIGKRYND